MPQDAESHERPGPLMIEVSKLLLDPDNPRLERRPDAYTQAELLEVLWRDFAVDELALSIAHNGFMPYEPLIAIATDGGEFVIIEGNRRLAALKLLLDDSLRIRIRPSSIPILSPEDKDKLRAVPVVVVQDREDAWEYIGFKHVNGPQVWQSQAKANYIVQVHHSFNIPLEEIASTIGDRHSTVRRLYRAQAALAQAAEKDIYSIDDRWNKRFAFSHLYTGLDYSGIASFVGIDPASGSYHRDPIPEASLPHFQSLCVWLWGSKSQNQPPLIQSQNPDLRILDDVIKEPNGLAALTSGLPLTVAAEVAKGDPRILRENLVVAKASLQDARGKVITGFKAANLDLLSLARDISKLARSLVGDMEDIVEDEERDARRATERGA